MTDTIYLGVPASHTGANAVDVLDGKTDTITATIPGGAGPEDIGINLLTDMIYFTSHGGGEGGRVGSVIVIDGKTNEVVATLIGQSVIGRNAAGAAVTPLDNSVYVLGTDVTDSESAALVIDGKTNTIKTEIPIGTYPLTADSANALTSTVYVADAGTNTVLVIDGKTNTVTATIAVGSGPDAVATDSLTGRTYGDDNTVSVIKG